MPFVFEADRNPIVREAPQFLHETIVEFLLPFAAKELLDRGTATKKLGAISPLGIFSVGARHHFGIACIPRILRGLDLGASALRREWWTDGTAHRRSLGARILIGDSIGLHSFHFAGSIVVSA